LANLGVPFRICYESKNMVSGLTDVFCRVLRPDLSIAATLPMAEMTEPGFQGLYEATLPTTTSDPEGEWIARIFSPTEVHVADKRISFQLPADLTPTTIENKVEVIAELEISGQLSVAVAQGLEITAELEALALEVMVGVGSEEIVAELDATALEARIDIQEDIP
jgi:hypothetical protein